MRGPGPPAALEGAWYQAASFRGGRGKLRAREGHRGESAASFTWLHDRHGVNIFVSASYVGTGCRRAGPPPKAGPAQAAVDSATEAPESGWFLAYSSSLGRRVIGEIIPESCIHLCEEPTARIASAVLGRQGQTWGGQVSDREQGRGAGVRPPARRPPGVGAAAPGDGGGSVVLFSPSHNSLYGTLTPPRPPPLRILTSRRSSTNLEHTVCTRNLPNSRSLHRFRQTRPARCPPRPGGSSPSPTPSGSSRPWIGTCSRGATWSGCSWGRGRGRRS